jgi:hypothetical protein
MLDIDSFLNSIKSDEIQAVYKLKETNKLFTDINRDVKHKLM